MTSLLSRMPVPDSNFCRVLVRDRPSKPAGGVAFSAGTARSRAVVTVKDTRRRHGPSRQKRKAMSSNPSKAGGAESPVGEAALLAQQIDTLVKRIAELEQKPRRRPTEASISIHRVYDRDEFLEIVGREKRWWVLRRQDERFRRLWLKCPGSTSWQISGADWLQYLRESQNEIEAEYEERSKRSQETRSGVRGRKSREVPPQVD